jgi:hypothetical protein
VPRQARRRPVTSRARLVRVRPWRWSRSLLLPIVELPLRLVAALWAARAVWEWLGEEGVVYVDPVESRFLLLAAVGAGGLAAIAAPLVTTRPALWGIELLSRLGPFRLAGASLGMIVGLVIGLLLVQPLPSGEAGLGAWLPFIVTLGCGVAGALAFAGRPGLIRRWIVPRPAPPPPVARPLVEVVPDLSSLANGRAPAGLEAAQGERTS